MGLIQHTETTLNSLLRPSGELQSGGAPEGWLQWFHPSARMVAAFLIVAGIAFTTNPLVLLGLYALVMGAAMISFLNLPAVIITSLVPAAIFGLPVILIFVLGGIFAQLGYTTSVLPANGLRAAVMMILRTVAAVTALSVVGRSLGFQNLTTALQGLRVPAPLIAALRITVAQIHLFASMVMEMTQARRLRNLSAVSGKLTRESVGVQAGVLLQKTMRRSGELHAGIAARSLGETAQRVVSQAFALRDYLLMAGCALLAAMGYWL